MVHKNVTSRIPNDDLDIIVVWTPRYPGDDRSKAVGATEHMPDARAIHFWDEHGAVSTIYGRVLNLPTGNQFAWDTYMVFDGKAEWIGSPPTPNHWMHQLEVLGRSHPGWLNADRFRQTTQQLFDSDEAPQSGTTSAES